MKISIIIVNYNRCALLKLALSSLQKAVHHIEHEIYVVDNASSDASVATIVNQFPEVNLIQNRKNIGFSKACNQGLERAAGQYVLIIHPDTITNVDALTKTVAFMDEHQDAGALSVRMIDGKGQYLPESKRALPKAWVVFFKLTGFYRLFPKSRLYNRYNAGWIEEFEASEVDVLSAAFMLIRKSVLQRIGLLDERFVMYGEDIDLSYRIRLSGFKNYYYPKTYIIHFKGQSLNTFGWQYLVNFYGAMFIFAGKYLFKPAVPHVKALQQLYPPASA